MRGVDISEAVVASPDAACVVGQERQVPVSATSAARTGHDDSTAFEQQRAIAEQSQSCADRG